MTVIEGNHTSPKASPRARSVKQPKNLTMLTTVTWAVPLLIIALIAGWQRRWISDDGLIVLRTVRNLQAGNGPVFNAGERVETNTSMLWQYSIYLFAEMTGGRLETVSLWMALILTGLAVLIGVLATGLLYRSRSLIFVPLGMVVYLAIPAARDFATSGLEWGLSIFWLSVLWLLLALWIREGAPASYRVAPQSRHAKVSAQKPRAIYGLAFWAGVSWLVRPELALYGGITGLIILIAARSWAQRAVILAVALPAPLAYQIFRMGYYGAIVPQTAVAKSANEALWGRGWDYVGNFVNPYGLWWAFGVLALVTAALVWFGLRSQQVVFSDATLASPPSLQRPATAIAILVVCALLHFTYVIRVGGDFMHGRMLLIPLFAILLPLSVVPLVDLRGSSMVIQPVLVGAGFLFCLGWAIFAINHPVTYSAAGVKGMNDLHVVDERTYWMYTTKTSPEQPPLYASDYMDMALMNGYAEANKECAEQREGDPASPEARQCSGVLLSVGSVGPNGEDDWIPVGAVGLNPAGQPVIPGPVQGFEDLQYHPMTVSFLNLGMTGMMAPLDTRVVDPMGLANPLAARMPQIENGRPGHDKYLPLEWQMADSSVFVPFLPSYIDGEEVTEIRSILYTEDFVELFHVYREPMSVHRFWDNIKYSLTTSRTLKFSDDLDDYEGVQPMPDAQIVWPQTAHK